MRRPFAYPLLARMARMMGTQASEAPQSVGDYYKFAATLHAQLLASIDKNSNANSEANAAANKSNAEANKSLREAMEKLNPLALGGQFCNSGGPCPKGGLGKLLGALGDERR